MTYIEILASTPICYGQTRRNINKHMNYVAKNESKRSAIAGHILSNNHWSVSQTDEERQTEICMPIRVISFTSTRSNAINLGKGNIVSNLFTRTESFAETIDCVFCSSSHLATNIAIG